MGTVLYTAIINNDNNKMKYQFGTLRVANSVKERDARSCFYYCGATRSDIQYNTVHVFGTVLVLYCIADIYPS